MRNFFLLKTLAVALLLTGLSFQREYTEIYDKYCTEAVLAELNVSEANRTVLRAASAPKLYVDVVALVSAYNGNGAGKLIAKAAAFPALAIILAIFCLLSFIIFFCFCCCCDRAAGATQRKAKFCTGSSLLFAVTSTALFVALFVFIGKLNTSMDKTSCGVATVPHDLLQGVQTSTINFIGFNNLTTLLTNFKGELGKLTALSSDFDAIINRKADASTTAAYNSLATFSQNYNSSTTTDGKGQKTKPITVSSLGDHATAAIAIEFAAYNDVAVRLTAAASTGKNLSSSSQVQTVQSTLQSVIDQITSISADVDVSFGNATTAVDYFNRYAPIGYWVTLGIGLVVILLAAAATAILWCCVRNNTNRFRCGAKFCLTLNSALIFILALVSVALVVVSIGLGTVCHGLGELLASTQVSTTLAGYNITLDGTVSKLINQCLPADASGDITSLLDTGSDVFNQTQSFLDGLTNFNSLRANLTATNESSITIAETASLWSKFKVSIYPDQANALDSLASLNNKVSCGGVTYVLNAANCTGGAASSSCSGIYDSASFLAPTCASDVSGATGLFTTLKTFTNDEDSLLGKMITDLSGSGSSTPATLFTTGRQAIKSVLGNVDDITNSLTTTLATAATFKTGLAKITDCRVVRLELNNIESTFCFSFNKNLYYFTAILSFTVFFLFLYSWCLCCAMRCTPNPEAIAHGEESEVKYADNNNVTVFGNEEQGVLYNN